MINIAKLETIITTAKSKTTDARWIRAIDKAGEKLASGQLYVTLLNGYALVTSENGTYHVNGHCDCPARVAHCYHRCAVRLIEMMEAAPAAPAPNAGILIKRERGGVRIDGWMV
jgi:hypothetical protein